MTPLTLPPVVREQRFGELVVYILLTGVGAVMTLTSWQYEVLTPAGRVSGGFMPLLSGLSLLILGGIKAATTFRSVHRLATDHAEMRSRGAARAAESREVDIFGRSGKQRLVQLGMVFAALVIASVIVPVFGLLGSLFLMSLFISAVVERRFWWTTLVISVASIGLVWLIFAFMLGIPLPNGFILDSILGG